MNVGMWGKALRGIPRLDKEEWNGLDVISRWLIATRAAVLIMTLLSAAIAGILAIKAGQFNALYWGVMAIGLILAHATNNLLNDLTDFRRGVDKDNYFRAQYGPQPLEHGLLTTRQLLTYAGITGGLALLSGIYLVIERGPLAMLLLAAGAFFVLFYTWPLKYVGLGEIAVLIVWGPLMVGGGYYVTSGMWDWNVVIAGLPYALGVTTVIFGKHIDKYIEDRVKGIHTLPVIIGEKAARIVVTGMVALQYLLVIYLVAIRFFSPVMLVVLLSLSGIPSFWSMYKNQKPESRPEYYPAEAWPLYYVAMAFQQNRRFGLFYLLGLILEVALHALRVI
ncbi:MAG TPA: prenyltransferase [Anaerolineaceae bacterium]|nr:prenyltransferase [Anaerolineaceae bacterium]